MCGILGSVDLQISDVDLNLIFHRGPDSGALEMYNFNNSRVYFGHRRLAIVDLSPSGNQPMKTADAKFALIFNGEIYNHLELRKKLSHIEFKGHSDTETILYYLATFGIAGVADFNGIFALSFLDIENENLYLARDPFGVKPLYYYKDDTSLLFSSEMRPLMDKSAPEVSIDALASLLKLRFTPSPDTLITAIKKLPAGHYMSYSLKDKVNHLTKYTQNNKINKHITFNQALYAYESHLEEAVKRQLMSDVPVGCMLSGGVDSALVTYYAQKHAADKIKTYTLGYEASDYSNEIPEATETANFIGTAHNNILIDQKEFKDIFKECARIIEEPLATTSMISMYYLNQSISKDLKVVLSGQGADEPLCGYTRYKGEIYRNYVPKSLISWSSYLVNLTKNEKLIRASNALGETDIFKRFEKTYAVFTGEEIEKLIQHKDVGSYDRIKSLYQQLELQDMLPAEAMMQVDMRFNLSDDLLVYTDKISMNFGLEVRVPMLDIELIKFLEQLPLKYKFKNNQGKYIHKALAAEIFPKHIIDRPKKGFLLPTETWFRGDLGMYYKDMLTSNDTAFAAYFNTKEVSKIFEQHFSGFNREKQIFLLISLYYWFQNNSR